MSRLGGFQARVAFVYGVDLTLTLTLASLSKNIKQFFYIYIDSHWDNVSLCKPLIVKITSFEDNIQLKQGCFT